MKHFRIVECNNKNILIQVLLLYAFLFVAPFAYANSKLFLEGSLSEYSYDFDESQNKVGYFNEVSSEHSILIEATRVHRFSHHNSMLGFDLIKLNFLDRINLTAGFHSLIENSDVTILPYSIFKIGIEYPITDFGSAIFNLQKRNYKNAKLWMGEYAVSIEKISDWLITPKFIVSYLEFENVSEQENVGTTTVGAGAIRASYKQPSFTLGIGCSIGNEAYISKESIVTTEVRSIELSYRNNVNLNLHPYGSTVFEQRPNIKVESWQFILGLEYLL